LLTAIAVAAPFASTALAQDPAAGVKAALRTAVFHTSELAQRGNVIATAQLHVQHAMNCLEGASGTNFRQPVGNPCQGQGAGIVPDLRRLAAANVRGANDALAAAMEAHTLALGALSGATVQEVQFYAAQIAERLNRAVNLLP
jgi:hypothetical protein